MATMPHQPPDPDPEPDRDDTDAGYRDTLEEEAYEQEDPDEPRESANEPDDGA